MRPYRGREAPEPIRLARALHVACLVSGSVRRSGSRLKVTVELVRGADGVRAWGEQYERTDGDVFAIEAEIARAVATAIGGRLLPRERVTLVTRPTGSATAYDHYLRGMYDLERRSPAGAARGIAEFEAALRLDPKFAKARAGLAWGYPTSYDWTWPLLGLSRDSLLARGLAAVELALAGDSTNAEAWRIRGLLLENRHADTFAGAATAFERSLALDPGNANTWHTYGVMLHRLGHDSSATVALHRALAIEPTRLTSLLHLAVLSARARRDADARRWLDSALTVDPGFFAAYAYRAIVRVRRGELDGALDDAQIAARLSAGDRVWAPAALAVAQAARGDTTRARDIAEQLFTDIARERAGPDAIYLVGVALMALGERERVIEFFEGVEPRGAFLWSWLQMPDFDSLRANPRFQRLVEQSQPPRAPR